MGQHRKKVCAVCGKQFVSGWNSHCKYNKHNLNKEQLQLNYIPQQPWCDKWFENLSLEMQAKYTTSNPSSHEQTNINESISTANKNDI